LTVAGPSAEEESLGPSAGQTLRVADRWLRRWGLGLALGGSVLLFVLGTTVLATIGATNLGESTWDLGLYQQALWSAAHHGPFYEAADFETGGFGSLLQVHSAFVLLALVPVYGAVPAPSVLFAVQSAAVGVAAIPLFCLSRSVTGSRPASFGVAVLYLAWAPTLGGVLDEFHIEAFVPLGLITLAYLLQTRRYLWSIPVALLAFLTMEVVPIFAFFLGVFFLWERWVGRPRPASGPRGVRAWAERLRSALLDRGAIPFWLLLAGSLVAYYSLLGLREVYLSAWFGFPPFPSSTGPYVIGGDPNALGFSPDNLGAQFFQKLAYWILVLALVGLLPLLAPRTLLLVAPWVVFTFFMPITSFVTFGFQYGLLVAGPLFVGIPWGVRALLQTWPPADPDPRPSARSRRSPAGAARSRALFGGFAVLVALNLLASPLIPWGGASGPGAYGFTYAPAPDTDGVRALAALVPAGATVLASDGLFPLLANNLAAYSLFWRSNPNLALPFGPTDLPRFVFLSENKLSAVPPWLSSAVYDPSDYGVRGAAWGTPLGGVLLFERGFNGTATTFGPVPSGSPWISAVGFVPAGPVALRPDPDAPSGVALATATGATGLLWTGPGGDLAAGHYLVVLWVRAYPAVPGTTVAWNENVFSTTGFAFGIAPWYSAHFRYASLDSTGYVPLVFPIEVASPVVNVQLTASALAPDAGISFAGAGIMALPP
jgi:uncharacterized membrane protein